MSDVEESELIAAVAADLRSRPGVAGSASIDARIMEAVRAESRASALQRAWGWATRGRTIELSPIMGMTLAAGIATVAVLSASMLRPGSRGAPAAVAAAAGSPARGVPVTVQFVLRAPEAREVSLAGDFNGWDATGTQLSRGTADGVWTVEVPLTPGRYSYTFVVDGQRWIADPSAPRALGDDFGRPSSVVTVAGSAL